MSEQKTEVQRFKRRMTGVVIEDALSKTIKVRVERKLKHPRYYKFVKKTKNYHAHDENNVAAVGDKVTIIESRPHSKLKTWELIEVEQKGFDKSLQELARK